MCDNFVLSNERLSVEISYPGKKYCGSRFDWNGFITQVTLDGKHTFCVPEALEPGRGSGGCGLCGEFGIHEPVGYDETPVGGYFPKIGIGLLKRPDMEPYDFFRKYEVMPIDSSVIKDNSSADLSAVMPVQNGYGYIYRKSISLCENRLKIAYLLANTGEKKISTTEYCHNFIGIDGNKIGSNYSLKLPCEINMSEVHGELATDGRTISWPDSFSEEFYCQLKDYECKDGYSWELYDSKSGAGVKETDDFTVLKFALWGYKHVVSPEAFIKIDLEPGDTKTWSREYEFF
jgi:hypothetical protein